MRLGANGNIGLVALLVEERNQSLVIWASYSAGDRAMDELPGRVVRYLMKESLDKSLS
jgi:hypothetical protein